MPAGLDREKLETFMAIAGFSGRNSAAFFQVNVF